MSEFERSHHTRITAETVNCLFVIAECQLVLRSPADVAAHWRLNSAEHTRTLVVNQATVFDWDQVEPVQRFPLML